MSSRETITKRLAFGQNFIDIALKTSWSVRQIEQNYLIFEMAILSPKNRCPLVSFTNPHPVISTG